MTVYASYAQFIGGYGGFPATALGTLVQADVEDALEAASGLMDDHFGGRWTLPLLTWPTAHFARMCCQIAAWLLMTGPRGYNPGAGADTNIRARYDEAMAWLDKIQRRVLHPAVTDSSAGSATMEQPYVISTSVVDANGRTSTNRGW